MIILKNYFVDFSLQNNEEKIEKKDIKLKKENNIMTFLSDNEKFKITLNDNIILEKDNDESLIVFDFKLNEETSSKYYIKDLDFYIDTKIKTKQLEIKDNYIFIEYDLWLSDEYTGNFKYEIKFKEV
mgnify:CR=1 FL=1